jgi:hypothetical protein
MFQRLDLGKRLTDGLARLNLKSSFDCQVCYALQAQTATTRRW